MKTIFLSVLSISILATFSGSAQAQPKPSPACEAAMEALEKFEESHKIGEQCQDKKDEEIDECIADAVDAWKEQKHKDLAAYEKLEKEAENKCK